MIAASAVLVVVAIGTLIFGVVWTDGLKMIGVSIVASVGAGGLLILGVRKDKTLSPAMVGVPSAGQSDAVSVGGPTLLEPLEDQGFVLDEPEIAEPVFGEPSDATAEIDLDEALAAPVLDEAADEDEVEVAPAKPARKPAARAPAASKAAARKPAARKPAARKPAARKPAAKKPAARKPAAKKPAAKKPAAKKPAARKPAARKPKAPPSGG